MLPKYLLLWTEACWKVNTLMFALMLNKNPTNVFVSVLCFIECLSGIDKVSVLSEIPWYHVLLKPKHGK